MNILQINSSALPDASISSRLASELVAALRAADPAATRTLRDLGRTPHPALDEPALQALFTPVESRTAEQSARVALDDALIAEIKAADVLVLAVPMYNFGVPGALKNWIDAIARARETFQYTERGPVGLLTNKKAYAVLTRGGIYRDQPTDSVVPYLKTVLGFLGITDVTFVYAEGLKVSPEAEARAIEEARRDIAELVVDATRVEAPAVA